MTRTDLLKSGYKMHQTPHFRGRNVILFQKKIPCQDIKRIAFILNLFEYDWEAYPQVKEGMNSRFSYQAEALFVLPDKKEITLIFYQGIEQMGVEEIESFFHTQFQKLEATPEE